MSPRFARRLVVLLVACGAAGAPRGVAADSGEPRPGRVLAAADPAGTALRKAPSFGSEVVLLLPQRTEVTVAEVGGEGWIRVVARVGARPVEGWLRSRSVADPGHVPQAPILFGPGSVRVTEKDVAAVGGRRDPPPGRPRDHHPVDALEVATHATDPDEVEAFVDAGFPLLGSAPSREPLWDPGLAARGAPEPSKAGDMGARLAGSLRERLGLSDRSREIADAVLAGFAAYFEAMRRSFDPVQEHLLGRAVAADVIAEHGIDPDLGLRAYVRMLGQAIVRTTRRLRPTLGGYHFGVLASDALDGLGAPGGYVLLTRGAILACRDEDELAALLAHEIAHVEGKHAERRVRRRGELEAMADGAARMMRSATGTGPREALEGHFDGVVERMLADPRFEDDLEHEADVAGSYLLAELGFDVWALRDLLRSLAERGLRHPARGAAPPGDRADRLEAVLRRTYGTYAYPEWRRIRAARFRERLGAPPPPRVRAR